MRCRNQFFRLVIPDVQTGIRLIRLNVGNDQAERYFILRTRRDYRMSHAVINQFHPDIALWNLAGFVVHSHNRAERYSLQLYLSRLFPILIIAIFFVTYHHAVSLFLPRM